MEADRKVALEVSCKRLHTELVAPAIVRRDIATDGRLE
jgi:hypothetical protein